MKRLPICLVTISLLATLALSACGGSKAPASPAATTLTTLPAGNISDSPVPSEKVVETKTVTAPDGTVTVTEKVVGEKKFYQTVDPQAPTPIQFLEWIGTLLDYNRFGTWQVVATLAGISMILILVSIATGFLAPVVKAVGEQSKFAVGILFVVVVMVLGIWTPVNIINKAMNFVYYGIFVFGIAIPAAKAVWPVIKKKIEDA